MIKCNNIIHIGVYMSNGTKFMYETMEGVARWKYRTVWGQVVFMRWIKYFMKTHCSQLKIKIEKTLDETMSIIYKFTWLDTFRQNDGH